MIKVLSDNYVPGTIFSYLICITLFDPQNNPISYLFKSKIISNVSKILWQMIRQRNSCILLNTN